ncbi:hypothetical protein BA6348_12415 [Brevibacillus agri]|nr:hypothetical protein BA6348_12415 [Brevibacillus agri]
MTFILILLPKLKMGWNPVSCQRSVQQALHHCDGKCRKHQARSSVRLARQDTARTKKANTNQNSQSCKQTMVAGRSRIRSSKQHERQASGSCLPLMQLEVTFSTANARRNNASVFVSVGRLIQKRGHPSMLLV